MMKKIKWALLVPLNFTCLDWVCVGPKAAVREEPQSGKLSFECCRKKFYKQYYSIIIFTDKSKNSDAEEVGHVLFLARLFSSLMFIPP